MKMSQLFGQTLRDAPSDSDSASHKLLLRAGFIRPLGAGIYTYLHLGKRTSQKIEGILRNEMDRIGGQEVCMPVVQPADLWKETGRWDLFGSEMIRFQDRNHHDMILAPTHEEVVADLVRREVKSYKHLPRLLYHIQTKFRDEPRVRAGLIRVREFTMKDSYSLDADWSGLDLQYRRHYQAYFDICHRCDLDVIAVKSDTGVMGGKLAHEYMYLNAIGEDTLILCDHCGYSANRQVARFTKPVAEMEEPKPIKKVLTPGCKSIEELANFLGINKSKTAKAVFFIASYSDTAEDSAEETDKTREEFIFAVIRGDMELNETKLANAIGALDLRPATEDDIKAIGAVPGFASPIGLTRNLTSTDKNHGQIDDDLSNLKVRIVVDDLVPDSPNLVAGSNEQDTHLLNTNFPRDYRADVVTDIAAAQSGFACPQCGNPLLEERGVEIGNIFQLGTRYSDSLGCTYLDKDGQNKPVIMGSYGIGVGRLLACVVEQHHDDHGLIWPITIAPYQIHLVLLRGRGFPEAEQIADKLYIDLQAAGMEVLYDDRDESPGVKFNDADLIGVPVRLTVSERALGQGGVEMKLRTQPSKTIVPVDTLIDSVSAVINDLKSVIEAKLVPVDYNG